MKLPKRTRERIAKKVLQIQTLETRNSDRLDFPDMAVWAVREALDVAFEAGIAHASKSVKPPVAVKGFSIPQDIKQRVNEKYSNCAPCPIHGDPCRCTP